MGGYLTAEDHEVVPFGPKSQEPYRASVLAVELFQKNITTEPWSRNLRTYTVTDNSVYQPA